MSTASRILAFSVSLAAMAMSGATDAADFAGQLPSIARAAPGAPQWRARPLRLVYPHHAPGELIAGVRGATPLTVPFFGAGWYPGPAYYYASRGLCCHEVGTVISVKY